VAGIEAKNKDAALFKQTQGRCADKHKHGYIAMTPARGMHSSTGYIGIALHRITLLQGKYEAACVFSAGGNKKIAERS
jgi:hypothetical protein